MSFEKNSNLIPTICSIQFANVNDVSSITVGTTFFNRVVTFKQGKTWTSIYNTPGKNQYVATPKKTNAGTYFEHRLSSFFPGDDAVNLSDFDNFENKRFVIRMNYTNGESRIFGDLINGAEISQNFETEKGGNTLSYYCDSVNKAFILE